MERDKFIKCHDDVIYEIRSRLYGQARGKVVRVLEPGIRYKFEPASTILKRLVTTTANLKVQKVIFFMNMLIVANFLNCFMFLPGSLT